MTEKAGPSLRPKDYRSEVDPVWCRGCGHFGVVSAVTRAAARLQLVRAQVAVISGIGCSSRLPGYLASYGLHGLHGRALPVAAGLKAARADLTVIAVGGDGDGFSIGGNHFLHACRRNMDLTYVVLDNQVYGMTKGQASPTTGPEWTLSRLTPEGTGMRCLRPAAIALAAGATFIARGFSGEPSGLTDLLVDAIQHTGFAFLHVLSPCPTFRPEQKAWKRSVHPLRRPRTDDATEAAKLLHEDDGMTLGTFFATREPVWRPPRRDAISLDLVEAEFRSL